MHEVTQAMSRVIPPVAGPQHRILIVEDHAESAIGIERLLNVFGHTARVACDGQRALEIAEAFRPTAALIDLTLPGLDGFEVARRLGAMPALRGCILISMTGWTSEEHAQLARRAGFHRHLIKPLTLDALMEALSIRRSVDNSSTIVG